MTILDSLWVGLFGMGVIFATLLGLSLLIRLQAAVVGGLSRRKQAGPSPMAGDGAARQQAEAAAPGPAEPLKLINVDEKTAAMLMAIVCDDLQAQPEELRFLSIREIQNDERQGRREP